MLYGSFVSVYGTKLQSASMLIFPVSHSCGLAFSAFGRELFCFSVDTQSDFTIFWCDYIDKHMNNHLIVADSACVADEIIWLLAWLAFSCSPVALSADERVLCLFHAALG